MAGRGPRRHSHEFKIEIEQRMLNGECVSALSEQYGLPRRMMYRWRDAYRKVGPAGCVGRSEGRRALFPSQQQSPRAAPKRRYAGVSPSSNGQSADRAWKSIFSKES